jgi:hypothetical protein
LLIGTGLARVGVDVLCPQFAGGEYALLYACGWHTVYIGEYCQQKAVRYTLPMLGGGVGGFFFHTYMS